jgi:hypothetical protein
VDCLRLLKKSSENAQITAMTGITGLMQIKISSEGKAITERRMKPIKL